MFKQILLVASGGAIGATLRFLLSLSIKSLALSTFPIATLGINVLGSFVMGIAAQTIVKSDMNLFLMVGVLGAFTTFSTFSLESMQLLQEKDILVGGIYIIGTLILNISACYAGYVLFTKY